MKKIKLLILSLLGGVVFLQAQNKDFEAVQKLHYVEQIIENYYVDSVNPDHIVEEAIIAMLKTLDPHSTYTNAEATKALTEPLQGNFSGIGIQFNMLDDTIRVIQTVVGGPSEKVGIIAGDRIMAANDTLISGVKMSQADAMKHLRGPKGSVVMIKVLRKGTPEPIEFRIVRDEIPTYSVSAAYMADDDTGYIKITLFGETTVGEVKEAIDKLSKQGMKDLVIDLEDNGGGYLMAAVELAEMFLDEGDMIVYTDGLNAKPTYYHNRKNGKLRDQPLVVMVNQYSASASEIFSGAIQDNDRGVIVGRRSFGKGLVQRPFPFPDGSMVRLTTSRYYTPSGRSIQKPYTSGDDSDYDLDILKRYQAGEFNSADSVHFDPNLMKSTLRLNRPVYGGGGIMPDAFVPIDTTYYTDYYRDLVAKAIINRWCIQYIDNNRNELKKLYPTEGDFVAKFEVTDSMLRSLTELGSREGVEFNQEQFEISKPAIETVTKGLIGRDLFEQSTYYRIANSLNPNYRKAIEIINSPREYKSMLSEPTEAKKSTNNQPI